ncbi:DUF7344 domain-containing protein [Halomicrobium salinisoli]|uniref:DUF7344 domain-containing protein n=1 Tax=Halomicrobium salinisoli TaxID=2878391 RepID=UPI001CEFD19A|nr:hypothetical protein [Halomicrobium salinisoli]
MVNHPPKASPSESTVGGQRQDELFDVLSDRRRRSVLDALRDAETPVPVAALAADLATDEPRGSGSGSTEEQGEAIRVSLVHRHLPKMAATGFVSYDDTRQTVSLADRTDEVRTHLQAMTTTSGGD